MPVDQYKSQVAPTAIHLSKRCLTSQDEEEATEFSPSRRDLDVSKLISNRVTNRLDIQTGRKVEDGSINSEATKRTISKTKLKEPTRFESKPVKPAVFDRLYE